MPTRQTAREPAAFVALAIVATAALWLWGSVLWTRPLWMDEWCAVFVVGTPSLGGALRLLHAGGDWAPPLLHLIVWPVGRVAELTPVLLRGISLACVAGALWFTFAALRRRFAVMPAAAGALAAAGHPLVLTHAFDIRPYAPWLLAAAFLAWTLGLPDTVSPRRRAALVALASVMVCTAHWFGVLSLGLMIVAVVAAHRRAWRTAIPRVAPAAAGLVALAACAPLLLGQRASAEGLGWVRALDARQLVVMAGAFWIAIVPIASVAIIFRDRLMTHDPRRTTDTNVARDHVPDDATPALLALLAMPVLIVVVSLVVAPAMVPRYAVVAALGWAPLAALATESLRPMTQRGALALLALMAVVQSREQIRQRADFGERVGVARRAFDQSRRAGVPVVFQDMHLMYAVAGAERGHDASTTPARFVALPDSTLQTLYPGPALQRLLARYFVEKRQLQFHERIFGFPIVVSRAQLDSTPRWLLVAGDLNVAGGEAQPMVWGSVAFPGYRVTRVGPALSLFERASR